MEVFTPRCSFLLKADSPSSQANNMLKYAVAYISENLSTLDVIIDIGDGNIINSLLVVLYRSSFKTERILRALPDINVTKLDATLTRMYIDKKIAQNTPMSFKRW